MNYLEIPVTDEQLPSKNRITMSELKAANATYFGKGNKRFFNDAKYTIMYVNRKPYLLTYTAGFSDMFGGDKSYFYTAKLIDQETLKIGYMIEKSGNNQFKYKDELKEYIKNFIH
jgi:hypothetical protein